MQVELSATSITIRITIIATIFIITFSEQQQNLPHQQQRFQPCGQTGSVA
jgi:hypothetical protein